MIDNQKEVQEPALQWQHNPLKNDMENFADLINHYFKSSKKDVISAVNENVAKSYNEFL